MIHTDGRPTIANAPRRTAEVDVAVTMVPRGFWLIRPTLLLNRIGLRRLALALATRFVSIECYVAGRHVCSVVLVDGDA